jgi:hypothetical protein
MKVLFIGDIIGKPGRQAVKQLLPGLAFEHKIDLVIANGENAAAGFGITEKVGQELFALGIDVLTSGNHLWDKKESVSYIAKEPRILCPANYPQGAVGARSGLYLTRSGIKVGVFGLQGRVFMPALDCPFKAADGMVERLKKETDNIIVDVHAEATSEKIALGWHLDGRVSAVIGTHTHVQTSDEKILPQGTAYITDIGMTGGGDGVIGMKREAVLKRFLTGMPQKFETAEGEIRLNAVVVDIDQQTGFSRNIERIIIEA